MSLRVWKHCTEPDRMLKRLDPKTHRRKWVLFNCACCRRIWDRLPDDACRTYVEAVERYALGTFKKKDLPPLKRAVDEAMWESMRLSGPGHFEAANAASTVINTTRFSAWNAARAVGPRARVAHRRERHAQADLLREIFWNTFRGIAVQPAWLTWNEGTVERLARAILNEGNFDCLPILADALEDAGCNQAEILAHCRGLGPHVRGCGVVDLLLGKV